jgi:beta-lactam-binding protein with PASTA domain
VDVVVASGSNAVPSVIGLPLDVATAAIQGAGFGVLVVSEIDRSAPTGTVLRSNPGGAADLLLGGVVTIVVAAAPPTEATPTPTPTPVPSATEAPPVIP